MIPISLQPGIAPPTDVAVLVGATSGTPSSTTLSWTNGGGAVAQSVTWTAPSVGATVTFTYTRQGTDATFYSPIASNGPYTISGPTDTASVSCVPSSVWDGQSTVCTVTLSVAPATACRSWWASRLRSAP